jgi:hypothetical protein
MGTCCRIPWLRLSVFIFCLTPGFIALSSCVIDEPSHEVMMEGGNPGAEVYVDESPPPPREEVIVGLAPAPNYVWVGGYWAWHHSQWYWVKGRWAARPRPGALWVPGRWEARGRGHSWVGGHWR